MCGLFPFLFLSKMRKLQSQKSQGVRGNVDGAGRAGRGDPALREAKKAELATWLASEIEVRTWKRLPSRGCMCFVPSLAEYMFWRTTGDVIRLSLYCITMCISTDVCQGLLVLTRSKPSSRYTSVNHSNDMAHVWVKILKRCTFFHFLWVEKTFPGISLPKEFVFRKNAVDALGRLYSVKKSMASSK